MVAPDLWCLGVYLFALIVDCCLVFVVVYWLALFSDLESDQINPIDMCSHLNLFVIPEMVAHGVVSFVLLVTGNFLLFALNAPLLAWNAYRFYNKKSNLDATLIFRDLSKETKVLFVKLGYFMICFCFYLFYLIHSIIS